MTIQTHPDVTRDLRQATREGLLPTRGSNWLAGFANMLTKELGEWFHTRRWLWQLLLWIMIINGFVALILFIVPLLESILPGINASIKSSYEGLPPATMGLSYYFTIAVMTGSIGVIILAQDEIIQEKQSGTVAWILSKPAARPAFILAKLLSNTIGALLFIVALPALVLLGEIYLNLRVGVPLAPFLAGLGVFLLTLIFALVCVMSALALVYTKHESRKLFIELEALNSERDMLNIEWGQLQIEQSTWATHARIERVAAEELSLTRPKSTEIYVIEKP